MVEINEKQIYEIIKNAQQEEKVKMGINEVTKSIERGIAKLVVYATDVSPIEIVAHLDGLSKEMKIPCFKIGSREELGAIVGIKKTAALCILDSGENQNIEKLKQSLSEENKEIKKEEKPETEKVEEEKVEEKLETKSETENVEEKKVEEKPETEKPETENIEEKPETKPKTENVEEKPETENVEEEKVESKE